VVNWKLSAILGGVGFVLSLLVGLFSGAGFLIVLLRAFIFAIVFFGLGAGLWLLINRFMPELLYSDTGAAGGEKPGSRINITLEDDRLLPEMFRKMDTGENVGDIGELLNGTFKPPELPVSDLGSGAENQGVDQMPEDRYTGNRSQDGQFPSDSPGGMPDFDLMAGSFLGSGNDNPDVLAERPEPERKPVGNKPQALKGDFSPKDLAAGIRTILSEDE